MMAPEDLRSEPRLTPRGIDVLELVLQGKHNPEIADALIIEESTVKWHLEQIVDWTRARYPDREIRGRIDVILACDGKLPADLDAIREAARERQAARAARRPRKTRKTRRSAG